jgi:RNA polymerase sigma-70 factor (ECF subfamily)
MEPEELAAALPAQLPSLLRFAHTLTADASLAEDLVQETVGRALERSADFRGDSSLATWLHRILHNLAVDSVRRSREDPSEDVAMAIEARWREDDYTVDPDAVIARAELRDDLREALSHLPVHYRTAVVLHDAEGMTMREIAQIQQVSLPAAKQRLRRGRMLLVSQLAADHERREELAGVPLRCWEARRHVSDYLDGELEARVARTVEKHLETCPTCPNLYAALVGTTRALASSHQRDPDTVVPPALAERLARSLSGRPEEPGPRSGA